jgi:hypothetical protein
MNVAVNLILMDVWVKMLSSLWGIKQLRIYSNMSASVGVMIIVEVKNIHAVVTKILRDANLNITSALVK